MNGAIDTASDWNSNKICILCCKISSAKPFYLPPVLHNDVSLLQELICNLSDELLDRLRLSKDSIAYLRESDMLHLNDGYWMHASCRDDIRKEKNTCEPRSEEGINETDCGDIQDFSDNACIICQHGKTNSAGGRYLKSRHDINFLSKMIAVLPFTPQIPPKRLQLLRKTDLAAVYPQSYPVHAACYKELRSSSAHLIVETEEEDSITDSNLGLRKRRQSHNTNMSEQPLVVPKVRVKPEEDHSPKPPPRKRGRPSLKSKLEAAAPAKYSPVSSPPPPPAKEVPLLAPVIRKRGRPPKERTVSQTCMFCRYATAPVGAFIDVPEMFRSIRLLPSRLLPYLDYRFRQVVEIDDSFNKQPHYFAHTSCRHLFVELLKLRNADDIQPDEMDEEDQETKSQPDDGEETCVFCEDDGEDDLAPRRYHDFIWLEEYARKQPSDSPLGRLVSSVSVGKLGTILAGGYRCHKQCKHRALQNATPAKASHASRAHARSTRASQSTRQCIVCQQSLPTYEPKKLEKVLDRLKQTYGEAFIAGHEQLAEIRDTLNCHARCIRLLEASIDEENDTVGEEVGAENLCFICEKANRQRFLLPAELTASAESRWSAFLAELRHPETMIELNESLDCLRAQKEPLAYLREIGACYHVNCFRASVNMAKTRQTDQSVSQASTTRPISFKRLTENRSSDSYARSYKSQRTLFTDACALCQKEVVIDRIVLPKQTEELFKTVAEQLGLDDAVQLLNYLQEHSPAQQPLSDCMVHRGCLDRMLDSRESKEAERREESEEQRHLAAWLAAQEGDNGSEPKPALCLFCQEASSTDPLRLATTVRASKVVTILRWLSKKDPKPLTKRKPEYEKLVEDPDMVEAQKAFLFHDACLENFFEYGKTRKQLHAWKESQCVMCARETTRTLSDPERETLAGMEPVLLERVGRQTQGKLCAPCAGEVLRNSLLTEDQNSFHQFYFTAND